MKNILSVLPTNKLERGVVIFFGVLCVAAAVYGIVTGASHLINGDYKTGYSI